MLGCVKVEFIIWEVSCFFLPKEDSIYVHCYNGMTSYKISFSFSFEISLESRRNFSNPTLLFSKNKGVPDVTGQDCDGFGFRNNVFVQPTCFPWTVGITWKE